MLCCVVLCCVVLCCVVLCCVVLCCVVLYCIVMCCGALHTFFLVCIMWHIYSVSLFDFFRSIVLHVDSAALYRDLRFLIESASNNFWFKFFLSDLNNTSFSLRSLLTTFYIFWSRL